MNNSIPEDIRVLRQWVCWKWVRRRDGRPTKVPVQVNGSPASTTDPNTWGSYEEVCAVAKKYSGAGFVFTSECGFTGIDLDHVRDASGLEPWAEKIVHETNSYTEISQSGSGVHIIVRARMPQGGNRKGRMEMYCSGRYFVMTGKVLGDGVIRDCDLTSLHARMLAGLDPKKVTKGSNGIGDESKKDFAVICELYSAGIRNAEAMEAEFKRKYSQRYAAQNLKHKDRQGKTYIRYSIDRFLENQAATPNDDEALKASPLPIFPQIAGKIHDIAINLAPLLPYAFKVGALATLIGNEIAGRVRIDAQGFQDIEPRFFTVLLGNIGTGKTPAKNLATELFQRLKPSTHFQSSEDSAADLVSTLKDHPRLILNPDEFARIMLGSDGRLIAKVPELLLELHTGHTAENWAKKNWEIHKVRGIEVFDARLGILGTSQPRNFDRIWVGSLAGSGGLHSRLSLFAAEAKPIQASGRGNLGPALTDAFERLKAQLEALPAEPIEIVCPDQILKEIDRWIETHPIKGLTKVADHIIRWLVILAFTNDKREITSELLQMALRMMEYQAALAELFLTADASDKISKMENAIVDAFKHWREVQDKKRGDYALSLVGLRRQVSPQNRDGQYHIYGIALRGLMNADVGRIIDTGRKNRKNLRLYVLDDYSQ